MICLSCNDVLTDEESSLVFEHGEHIDLCKDCLDTTEIKAFQYTTPNEKEYHHDNYIIV